MRRCAWIAALVVLALPACRKWKDPAPPGPGSPAAQSQEPRPDARPTAPAPDAPPGPPAAPQDPVSTVPPSAETRPQELDRTIKNPSVEPFPCAHLTILARDATTGDLALGMLTGCPSGPGFMTAGKAGVGIAVCGNFPDSTWAQRAVEGLAAGKDGEQVLRELQKSVPMTAALQLGLLAADGRCWVFTGTNTLAMSADVTQQDLCVFGSGMVRPDLVALTRDAFLASDGLPLAERILLALREATTHHERNSTDTGPGALSWRNRPVAGALQLLRPESGHDGRSDRLIDLRLDWEPDIMRGLEAGYRNLLAAIVWPRLKLQQREIRDLQSPLYRSNVHWIERIRSRKELGER